MVTGLIGKKIGMTQLFTQDGNVHPATVLKAGPMRRLAGEDGGPRRLRGRAAGTRRGEAAQGKQADRGALQEGRCSAGARDPRSAAQGRRRSSEGRRPGQRVNLRRRRACRCDRHEPRQGLPGVVKRHHFKGGRMSHGSMFHRAPGSIGASSYPSRVVKGMRMGGHMGAAGVTTRNLKVLRVDPENNLLLVEGSVPGGPNAIVVIRKAAAAKTIKVAQVEPAKKKGKK